LFFCFGFSFQFAFSPLFPFLSCFSSSAGMSSSELKSNSQHQPRRIKAIIFDLGGTLVGTHEHAHEVKKQKQKSHDTRCEKLALYLHDQLGIDVVSLLCSCSCSCLLTSTVIPSSSPFFLLAFQKAFLDDWNKRHLDWKNKKSNSLYAMLEKTTSSMIK
jgi:hypothetical protein